jgi:hypothetical protein
MKSINRHFFCFAIIFFLANSSVNAQFVKNILNNAKQTAQNRSSDKANQVTNKAFDKVDSLTQVKPKHRRKKKHNAAIQDTLNSTGYNILMRHGMPVFSGGCAMVTEKALTLDVYFKGPKDVFELLDGDRTREGFQFEI